MNSTNNDDDIVFLWRKNRQGVIVEDTNGTINASKKHRKILLEIDFDDDVPEQIPSFLKECSICLQPMQCWQSTGTGVSSRCIHTKSMHYDCLYEWYIQQVFPNCPLCRKPL